MTFRKVWQKAKKAIVSHRRKLMTTALTFLIGATLFGTVFLYADLREIIRVLYRFSLWKFALYLILPFLILLLSSLRWSLVLKAYGWKVKFWHLFRYYLAGFGFSYLTPIAELGGAPFRAHLLRREGIPFGKGLLTVIVDDFISIFSEALIATMAILYLVFHLGFKTELSWVIGTVSGVFILILFFTYLRLRQGKPILSSLLDLFGGKKWRRIQKLSQKIYRFEGPFIEFFNQKRSALKKALFLTAIVLLLGIGEVGVLLYFMGQFSGWLNAFLARMIVYAANLFPVPAGLGVSEWGEAGFFGLTSGSQSAGFVFSILFKARTLFFAFLGIGIFLYYWLKELPWHQKIKNYLLQKLRFYG